MLSLNVCNISSLRPIVSGLALFFILIGNAQSRKNFGCQSEDQDSSKNLLYQVELADANSSDYFIPIVEKVLREMVFSGSEKPLYDSITSLNVLNGNKVIEKSVFNLFQYYDQVSVNIRDSQERIERYDSLSKFLQGGYQRFLRVKINPLPNSDYLEFQFWMFDVKNTDRNKVDKKDPGRVPTNEDDSRDLAITDLVNYSSSSALLNLRKDDHEKQLTYALKKVNPEANIAPNLTLFTEKKSLQNTSEIFVAVDDTISLVSVITDRDSPRNTIEYQWSADGGIGVLNLVEDAPNQQLVFTETGSAKIEVSVTDGICTSEPYVITVKAINRPQLQLRKTQSGHTEGFLSKNFYQSVPTATIRFQRIKNEPNIIYQENFNLRMTFDDGNSERSILKNDSTKVEIAYAKSEKEAIQNNYTYGIYNRLSKQELSTGATENFMFLRNGTEDPKADSLTINTTLEYTTQGIYDFVIFPYFKGVRGNDQNFRLHLAEYTELYVTFTMNSIFNPKGNLLIDGNYSSGFAYQFPNGVIDMGGQIGIRPQLDFTFLGKLWITLKEFSDRASMSFDTGIGGYQTGELHKEIFDQNKWIFITQFGTSFKKIGLRGKSFTRYFLNYTIMIPPDLEYETIGFFEFGISFNTFFRRWYIKKGNDIK